MVGLCGKARISIIAPTVGGRNAKSACGGRAGLRGPGVAPEVRAATYDGYTSFWTLGDSLSDDGNLYAATGGKAPPAPYFDGRFSNGPVWAEHVAADFAAKGLATGNFAYGGAATEPLANGPYPGAAGGQHAAGRSPDSRPPRRGGSGRGRS